MADNLNTQRMADITTFGIAATSHTPAATDLPGNVRAVVFDAAGTMSFKNSTGGSTVTGFPVLSGVPLPFIPVQITAMTGPTTCFLIT
ncbi:MAG TPA: hypothetical protein PKV23_10445 [Aestuariivirga sp.]|jgi:hypothetical protein|nr:hypothetical protein [Chitinophagaceae bacterium]HQX85898.1 hypothetical protein [Aestuariivirga sp.]